MNKQPRGSDKTNRQKSGEFKALAVGIAFLSPSLLGFLTFTLLPLCLSLGMAFTNWDLRLHNAFKHEPVRFVGLDNFRQLIFDPSLKFWPFLGNTLFLMIGMPIGIAMSLAAALLLNSDLSLDAGRQRLTLFSGAVLLGSSVVLLLVGVGGPGMAILMIATAALILIAGTAGGVTVYRTLFYIPNFVSGVATMLLWKQIFNPQTGPLNIILSKPLRALTTGVNHTAPGLWVALACGLVLCISGITFLIMRRYVGEWVDGEIGTTSLAVGGVAILIAPAVTALRGWLTSPLSIALASISFVAVATTFSINARSRTFRCASLEALGGTLLTSTFAAAAQFTLLGLAITCLNVHAWASAGSLSPPNWLSDFYWIKPALMLMGFWGAIGSQTMLLYLAALTAIPGELYEAADIDGASKIKTFWNVTWPQLAPTTLFCVVIGVIGGLQSGFDAARVMGSPPGGPAGSATTISYMIFTRGFEEGRLGLASAAAWMLFVLVLVVTLLNLWFGSRYVND